MMHDPATRERFLASRTVRSALSTAEAVIDLTFRMEAVAPRLRMTAKQLESVAQDLEAGPDTERPAECMAKPRAETIADAALMISELRTRIASLQEALR